MSAPSKIMLILLMFSSLGASAMQVKLEKTVLPVDKRQTLLKVSGFGRCALTAKSSQGAGLQLIDSMSGPGRIAGKIGQSDGRMDLILETGEYKIAAYCKHGSKEQVTLAARTFRELNQSLPFLVEFKTIETQLGDFEQASYWLEIKKRRYVAIEAAGRHLRDLRLWKDGNFLIDAALQSEDAEPQTGKPLGILRLVVKLNPGFYLLTAYGGLARPWSVSSEQHPLYIRYGIQSLPAVNRQVYTASPFGVDRWWVSEYSDYFHLELDRSDKAGLQVTNFDASRPFSTQGQQRLITKKSRVPAVELSVNRHAHLVTIQREPGKTYELTHFQINPNLRFTRDGHYLVTTIYSRKDQDEIDPTGILTIRKRNNLYKSKEKIMAAAVVEIGKSYGFQRRCNLQKTFSIYFKVMQACKYITRGQGPEARFLIEPFLLKKPKDYQSPSSKPSGAGWELEKGYYVLKVIPETKGILNFSILPASMKPDTKQSPRNNVSFPNLKLDSDFLYQLYLNQRPDLRAGLVLKKLPLKSSKPLVATASKIKSRKPLQKHPVLSKKTIYFNLGRKQRKTFLVKARPAGLFRLETTGLLKTSGNLRTRVIPSLERQTANGVGRNFLIQQYLRKGEFHLTVASQDDSKGHLGLKLIRTQLRDGGMLTPQIPARLTLNPGEGLLYNFQIKTKKKIHLKTLGLNRKFRVRLEDNQGWPLMRPGIEADITRTFEPGNYRYIILPTDNTVRVVTILEEIYKKPVYKGHGPFIINSPGIQHVWKESGQRIPDQWEFNLTAPAMTNIKLSPGMTAEVHTSGSPPLTLPLDQAWQELLPSGQVQIKVKSSLPNNLLPYSLKVDFIHLTPGQRKIITPPAEVLVSVATKGPVEFQSLGAIDTHASLYDAQGNLLLKNDDRPDDWNFYLTQTLEPGFYKLKVRGESRPITVTMDTPLENQGRPLIPPLGGIINLPANKMRNLQVQTSGPNRLLLINISAAVNISARLEDDRLVQKSLGKDICLRLVTGLTNCNLKLHSVDGSPAKIMLKVNEIFQTPFSEKKFINKGVLLKPKKGVQPLTAAANIALQSPGVFRVSQSLLWTSKHSMVTGDLIVAQTKRLWLLGKGKSLVKAQRIFLQEAPLNLNLPPGRSYIDLPTERPLLIRAVSTIGQPALSTPMTQKKGMATTVIFDPAIQKIMVWNALEPAHSLPVTITSHHFKTGDLQKADWGSTFLTMKLKQEQIYQLPAGPKRTILNLPAQSCAVMTKNNKIMEILVNRKQTTTITVENNARQIHFFNTGEQTQKAGLQITPLKAWGAITAKNIFRKNFVKSGVLRARVSLSAAEKKEGVKLEFLGEVQARVMETSGRMQVGRSMRIHNDAVLDIEHQTGFMALILEGDVHDPWIQGLEQDKNQLMISAAQTIKFKGPLQFGLDLKTRMGVHFNTNNPLMLRLSKRSGVTRTQILPYGGAFNFCATPDDGTKITLVPIHADSSGRAFVFFSDIINLGDGTGPEIRLGPSDSRFYRFNLKEDRTIGLGIRTSADLALCRLFDLNGHLLGRGMIQMPALQRGEYFIEVIIPADGLSVIVQPIIAGLNPPPSPPPEEIKKYLNLAQ